MIRVEFSKQMFRLRTYLALGLTMLIPTVLTLALRFGGPRGGRGDRDGNGLFELARHSGLNLPLAALAAMSTFLLPIVATIFAGSAVAEEATWGTLRYLLVRPVSRSRFLASKLAVAGILAIVATLLAVLTATIEGVIVFGWHPLITTSLTTISPEAGFARLAIATLYVIWSMGAIIAFAFLISTMTDTVMGAVAGGFGLAIVSQILNSISPLGNIRSVMPTHYWGAWQRLFASPVELDTMVRGVFLQVPYLVIFLALAWWWFHRKDILT